MKAQILVIEDNPANMELMAYLLEHAGHDVRRARHGEQAMSMMDKALPELVICDIHLPHVDGRSLLPLLRAKAKGQRMPVIAVTALAMIGDRDKLLAEGFDGYLSKPIEPQNFVRQIEAFLAQPNS